MTLENSPVVFNLSGSSTAANGGDASDSSQAGGDSRGAVTAVRCRPSTQRTPPHLFLLTQSHVRTALSISYGASLLANSVFNETGVPLPSDRRLTVSCDATLLAFAQLCAFKLDADRVIISLFDRKYQHIIAEATQSTAIDHTDIIGLSLSGTATLRDHGICQHVLDMPAVQTSGEEEEEDAALPILIVANLLDDPRFSSKPLLKTDPPFRSFAGVPLRTPEGIDIGVCSVFHADARTTWPTDQPQRFLRHLANLVISHLRGKISIEGARRSDRMVRGLGSMVEGNASMSKWRDAVNPQSFMDVQGKEGRLNAKQQNIQAHGHMAPLLPTADATFPAAPSAKETDKEVPRPDQGPTSESADTLASTSTSNTVQQSMESSHQDDNVLALKSLFSRAANIIRESIEVEGVLFLDAERSSYEGLLSNAPETSSSRSTSSHSSGDESILTEESASDTRTCRVLGFSTSDSSSINGDEAAKVYGWVPDTIVSRILRRYARGQIFNFGEDGLVIGPVSDSEEGDVVPDLKAARRSNTSRPRKGDGIFLKSLLDGATSVAVVPLYDPQKEHWFSAGFVWTKSRSRAFTVQDELSWLQAFAAATMAEVARIEVLRENKAKEDVLGSLSHEIRSPLHGILLAVELMHDSVMSGFQKDIVHTVETCGNTLLDTLNHLLDFSKVNHFLRSPKRRAVRDLGRGMRSHSGPRTPMEAGMMSIFSDVNLSLLLEEVVESVFAGFSFQNSSSKLNTKDKSDDSYFEQRGTVRRLQSVRSIDNGSGRPSPVSTRSSQSVMTSPKVSVYLSVDPSVSWVFHAQPGALRRVIMNIFGNALKYTARGTILVSLTQKTLPLLRKSRRGTIVLCISDSGQGINPEYLQHRLFTPFSQENQLSQGAGLGLSIVKRIIQGLSGRISVESRLGHGTSVIVEIPLTQASPRSSPDTAPLQANEPFEKLLASLEGLSICLLGFSDCFDDQARPLATVGSEDASSICPRALLDAICQKHLHLTVLSEEEARANPPTFNLCTAMAQDRVFDIDGRTVPSPTVVICENALVARNLTASFAARSSPAVLEFVSQP